MAENSIFRKTLNLIPPNIRQFTYDLFGGDGDFTEKDLSAPYKEELKGIAEHSLSEGKNTISYEDYNQGTMENSLFTNLLSKNYNLKTLIGSGKVTLNENGEIIVTDKFDFNDAKDINSLADVKEMMSGIVSAFKGEGDYGSGGLYSVLREVGTWLGSNPGQGSDIEINLGKYKV
tara:strand:+ start:158 stop:682 length:525 start_codon:yes stop_codon:yes gene_type:complete